MSSTFGPENLQIPVVVKLVNGPYGEEVHQLLARHGLAPTLYGCAHFKCTPTAYIMEHLNGDWVMLFDFLQRELSRPFYPTIRHSLEDVVGLLKNEGFIHGDFRSSNVMVQIHEGNAQIKVIDFDWAGKPGQISYSAVHNITIGFPGKPYDSIRAEDDLTLLDSWWEKECLTSI
ncbi:uncharacterized protein LAESUDRAFT_715811 [Laetiporus sulphureus 93-53]|uniref:Protein kinase domain-containing protein n=1 Tax=Laetiporus sulphureus 93-53 TaxID=1314785 RepID=A0A165D3T8_9APHY|nr:uncharacterized protein LAESUDRAFT_715811 [Laetiporus sulphureus 93-53]KZT04101.1 hypothetical protein LAESUDRAFT_715811 [Laetiporus sulphureus 93-53]